MLNELAASTLLVLLTVAIHGGGLALTSTGVDALLAHHRSRKGGGIHAMAITLVTVLSLFVVHGAEIWLYAAFYVVVDALPDFPHALYFSTITYSTIGFDDEGLKPMWRLVSAIEGINGILLLGWSTAFFVRVIGRLSRR